MATNIPVINLGESISQVTILRWMKNEGDFVAVDEALVEVETDKVNTELRTATAGKLHQVRKVGDVLKIGEVFASVDEKAAAPAAGAKPTAPDPAKAAGAATTQSGAAAPAPRSAAVNAAGPNSGTLEDMNPSARRQVLENKLDPAAIKATGPHGRLLGSDVADHVAAGGNGNSQGMVQSAPTPAEPVVAPPTVPTPPPVIAGPKGADPEGVTRVPLSKIRIRTAINLKNAQNTAAILTTFNEVDMSAIIDLRTRHKERFEKIHGVGLGFMSFFARAVVLGLREYKGVNAFIDGDDILYHDYVNLGIAVSGEKGLTVPVLRHAEKMSFAKIESEIKRLAAAVREGKLGIQELGGGTFTITNGGVFGSLLSTPILNPPQSGILGMHAINKRPIAVNDQVVIRPMMYVALSYDHRMVDGQESVRFLVRIKEYLEDPARLMLEV